MSAPTKAVARYLARHAEANLPAPPNRHWQHVLVIPCYREAADLLETLRDHITRGDSCLIVLVLNRPDHDTNADANSELRNALHRLSIAEHVADHTLFEFTAHTQLLLLDWEQQYGPNPEAQGVGLARKVGCDLALSWYAAGAIASPWLHSSDADARLPADYFTRFASDHRAAAICWPYYHRGGTDAATESACHRYELRLHHYVLGLRWAGSPYAFHTLGSSLSAHAEHYAQVGGFPKRNGAEDFYLLNKIAKTGSLTRATGPAIQLSARASQRVPFGTGPAVGELARAERADTAPLYYHPQLFTALRAVLTAIAKPDTKELPRLQEHLQQDLNDNELSEQIVATLTAQGIDKALAHCGRQSSQHSDFLRHFHQWFDGFRTLKFLHLMRDQGWPDINFLQLQASDVPFWSTELRQSNTPQQWLEYAWHLQGWECG